MANSGQTLNDRFNAFRYGLAGQGLAREVCKATTEEVIGPKKKHLDYLLQCTKESNVSIPHLANLLIERTQHSNWAVVFKALITIHHLMSHGNERFTQYLATSNHSFELNDFMDRTTPQGYKMSSFVRSYAKYINDKSKSYRILAIDLCKIKSGNDNALRTMNMDNLSKTLPIVQQQFDCLLEFAPESKDLNNGIIMAAFRLIYKDLVKMYVAYQEAIINLLERYFKLSRRKTREALEMYKNYLARMDKVAEFLRVVEAVGLDKSEMPDLTKSPASILKILEQHLAQLEAKKRGATPGSPGEEEGENKENEAQGESSKVSEERDKQDSKKVEAEQKPVERPAETPSPKPVVDKQPAPSKPTAPTRPSPIVSPKASPSSPKQAPLENKQPVEKKAPPERPAKPPSRPPPPSAAAPAPSSSSSSANQPSTSSPSSTKTKSATESGASTAPKTHASPPPHPPPPSHPHPPVRTPSPVTTSPVVAEPSPPSPPPPLSSNDVGLNNSNDNDTAHDQPSQGTCTSSGPSCSAGANADAATLSQIDGSEANSVSNDSTTHGTNHVNNVNNNNGNNNHEILVGEEDMPAPPPPIEDEPEQQPEAEVVPEAQQQVAADQPVAEESEPQVNGSAASNGEQ